MSRPTDRPEAEGNKSRLRNGNSTTPRRGESVVSLNNASCVARAPRLYGTRDRFPRDAARGYACGATRDDTAIEIKRGYDARADGQSR